MRLLALDIGRRHTGIAYYDDAMGIPLPLDTLTHDSSEELCAYLQQLSQQRGIDRVIVGLPLLPSGKEGAQAQFVRDVGAMLEKAGMDLSYLDERYTTPRQTQGDGNAAAACSLLEMALRNYI